MSFQITLFPEFARFKQNVILDDVQYTLKFDYNGRGDFWSMSFWTLDDELICGGLKVVLNYELIRLYKGYGLPPGEMYALDTTDTEVDVDRDNFGHNVQILYTPESEL